VTAEQIAIDYPDLAEVIRTYAAALVLLRARFLSADHGDGETPAMLPTLAMNAVLATQLASLETTVQHLREDLQDSPRRAFRRIE